MGPQQGPVDSPRLGVSSLASSPDLSRPRNLQETVAPIKLYISEAGDYNHSAQSGQSYMYKYMPPLIRAKAPKPYVDV